MGKLNTYTLNTAVDAAFQMLGIIPGSGSTFQTVRVSPAALIDFIQQHSVAADGREVELQKSATHVQWRYAGDTNWTDLIPLADITGPTGASGVDGADGDEVEMRTNSTHVQWKLLSEAVWKNLIPLADLKGEAGTGLTNRGVWSAGTFNPGDYVFSIGSIGSGNAMWVLSDSAPYASSVQPKDDPTHWIEQAAPAGPAGDDGLSVELQKTATHIQWRQTGGSWANLVPLADLVGAPGSAGVDGQDGADGVSPNLSIGTVSTLAAEADATASLTGTFPNLALNLGIPRGAQGDAGSYDGPVIGVPTAGGKVLMSGDAPVGSTYWGDAPTGGGSGPIIPMNTTSDKGKVLLAGSSEGTTYWGNPPTGGYPVPGATDAGKFLRAGDVLGTAYWDTPPSGSGGGSGGGVVSGAFTINDGAVRDFNLGSGAAGMCCVYHEALGSEPATLFMFQAGASPKLFPVVEGSVGAVQGAVDGSTGNAGAITVGITDGHLLVENRLGWATAIKVFISVPEV